MRETDMRSSSDFVSITFSKYIIGIRGWIRNVLVSAVKIKVQCSYYNPFVLGAESLVPVKFFCSTSVIC